MFCPVRRYISETPWLRTYKGGVIQGCCNYNATAVTANDSGWREVVITGYGTTQPGDTTTGSTGMPVDYWEVKGWLDDHWNWGESGPRPSDARGYFRIKRGLLPSENCGLETDFSIGGNVSESCNHVDWCMDDDHPNGKLGYNKDTDVSCIAGLRAYFLHAPASLFLSVCVFLQGPSSSPFHAHDSV